MSFIQAKPPGTYDFYAIIHKGLRHALSQLMVRIARTDPLDSRAAALLAADLRIQLRLSAKHLHHEDHEIHAALETRCPGAAERLERSHEDHRGAFAEIEALLVRFEAAASGDRRRIWRRLYLRFTEFVAADLAHMAEEELVTLPVLQSLFTDGELEAMEMRVLAGVAPGDMAGFVRIMIAGGARSDQVWLVGALKAGAPPQAFDALVTNVIRPQMSLEEWNDIAREALAA